MLESSITIQWHKANHADVLRQVKAEMASAAGEMEKALSISAAAPVPPATQASTAAVK